MFLLNRGIESLRFCVAELGFYLDLNESGLFFSPTKCMSKFIQHANTQAGSNLNPASTDTFITVINTRNFPVQLLDTPIYSSSSWQFWKTPEGRLVFFVPDQRPALQLVVDPDFSRGEVAGDFSEFTYNSCYPLENLDIRLLSARLAAHGDVMLHASGVIVDGRGYCFTGDSGAGKSTLAASLSRNTTATVLGEDQVVLRYLDGRFWIYGTPWHIHEEMCSPVRAPLEKIFFINYKAPEGVSGISRVDGVTRLLSIGFIPYHLNEYLPGILKRLALLSEKVPFYSFSYRLGTDPWSLIDSA